MVPIVAPLVANTRASGGYDARIYLELKLLSLLCRNGSITRGVANMVDQHVGSKVHNFLRWHLPCSVHVIMLFLEAALSTDFPSSRGRQIAGLIFAGRRGRWNLFHHLR